MGRFSSCTGVKRKKEEKGEIGEKGIKKQKEKRKKEEKGIEGDKKEEKGTNWEKKGEKFGKFFKMNGTIYIPEGNSNYLNCSVFFFVKNRSNLGRH